MPWMETSPMGQRERFIHDHRVALYTMVDLLLPCPAGPDRRTGLHHPSVDGKCYPWCRFILFYLSSRMHMSTRDYAWP